MTDLRKAAEMALEAWDNWAPAEPIDLENKIEALRQALAGPKREWVGLTDDEKGWCAAPTYEETVNRTEAKLKEKNT